MSKPGSIEDIFHAITRPDLEFKNKVIPKGSSVFQLVIRNVENEKRQIGSDTDEDDQIAPLRLPSVEYMSRRRNTVASFHPHVTFNLPPPASPRRGSILSREKVKGKLRKDARARSLSPISERSKNNSSLAFGSTRDRVTRLQ